MIDCSIRVVTVLLGYLDLLIATSWGPVFGIWGPPKSWGPRRLPTLPTPKAGPDCVLMIAVLTVICIRVSNMKMQSQHFLIITVTVYNC